jgi:hypothetical protein
MWLVSFNSISQEIESGGIDKLLTRDFILGVNLNTSGWGLVFDFGRQKTFKYKNTFGFVLTNIRHQKEYKLVGTSGTKGYYFGKINSLVAFRPTYGGNLLLFKSTRENGIEVQFKWRVGPSFGLVKPVYLEIDKVQNGVFLHFAQRYNPSIHYPGTIYSRASWFKGVSEATMKFGLFFKSGLDFNFSTLNTGISGGEIGVMVDYYPIDRIEIMYQEQNLSLYASFYLQFNLGKKF